MTAFGRFRSFAALLTGTMLRRQPLAAALSVAAVALAAGMVLRVTCSFSAAADRLEEMMADVTIHFDRIVTEGDAGEVEEELSRPAIAMPHPALPGGLLDRLRADSAVETCLAGSLAVVEVYPGPGATPRGRRGPPGAGPSAAPSPRAPNLSTNITDPMFRMAGWMPGEMAVSPLFSPEEDAAPFGVPADAWSRCLAEGSLAVPSAVLRQFGLSVGDSVFLAGSGGRAAVPVGAAYDSGTADRIRGLLPVYAPRTVFESVTGAAWRPNRAYLRLRDGTGGDFDAAFADAPGAASATLIGPDWWRQTAASVARGRGGSGFDAIPYSAVFLANMAALFLLLSTLAMNIQGPARELTILRAIGAPAWMPAAAVVLQGLALAFAGWLVGAAFGLHAFRATLPAASQSWLRVLSLARSGLLLSTIPILSATLLAALPAVWMVTRLHPLEPATPPADAGRRAFAWGLAALLLHPLLAWTPLARGPLAQSLVLPAAYLLAMAGAILMVPGLLRALARGLAVPLGGLLRLHPLLLRDHNQSGLWQQTLGAAALLVSLAFYLTTAIWGASMRTPFVAGEKAPNAIAVFLPEGPLPERAADVAAIPGVTADSAMRLTHLRLSDDGSLRGKVFAGSELILLRADLPDFLSRITHAVTAGRIAPLADGECVVMTQMPIADPGAFRIGKSFWVSPLDDDPGAWHTPSELTPVGVLDIPGWQLITKSTRMRRGMNRTLSLVFVNDATFDRYAPSARENCHWLSLAPDTDLHALQRALDALRPYPSAYVKLTDVAAAQAMINRRSDSVIEPLLRLPLMVLGLSSLAVLVSLLAAAWARRHTFALLDALGLTRFQLARLLLGEALLLALAAILLGTLLALLFAETGILLCNRMMTVRAPYILPPASLLAGAAATLGSTLGAALLALPALRRRAAPSPDRS